MSGGAGYILSRGALQAFVDAGQDNQTLAYSQGAEDVQMGEFLIHFSGFKIYSLRQ